MSRKIQLKLLGMILKKLRKSKGLSQADLSKEIKILPSTYSRIERGEVEVGFTTYFRLQEYFAVDLQEQTKESYEELDQISALDYFGQIG